MAPGWPMPLPPAWNRNIDCGWVEFKSGRDDVRGYFARPKGGKNLTAITSEKPEQPPPSAHSTASDD